ncbi:MAG: ImmA/IrrE family metallo-endopeptidase [Planctomycetota bacterium]|jgi:hypothetical protein
MKKFVWTHQSVKTIETDENPIQSITNKARQVVYEAIQQGWTGPPFNPFKLAELLNIQIKPNQEVLDARTIPIQKNRSLIEYNPYRPQARMRYSVAHEIAHTLFPDYRENIRERKLKSDMQKDDWQLEMLCNIGAAEILMPIGSFPELNNEKLSIDHLLELRKKFGVSCEALLLRAVKVTSEPCFVFCCSKREDMNKAKHYNLDYCVSSKTMPLGFTTGMKLPEESLVGECLAVGFTAKGNECWLNNENVHIECVGLPPYPFHKYPRVIGVGTLPKKQKKETCEIKFLKGDATRPRGDKNKIIAFIINDKGRSWGAGFARAVQNKWPLIQEEFGHWIDYNRSEFKLGNVFNTRLEGELSTFNMICQRGYGESAKPRIRYGALETCLGKLSEEAKKRNASVHMPRIGCGQAGGNWLIIQELIETNLCAKEIEVFIYDLPGRANKRKENQAQLFK